MFVKGEIVDNLNEQEQRQSKRVGADFTQIHVSTKSETLSKNQNKEIHKAFGVLRMHFSNGQLLSTIRFDRCVLEIGKNTQTFKQSKARKRSRTKLHTNGMS